MMTNDGAWPGSLSPSRRATVALLVIALHALVVLALFQRWDRQALILRDRALDVLDLRAPPPPAERSRTEARQHRRSGASAPPNLKNVPTQVVAPPPVLPPIPVPVIAAPVAGPGAAANAGAALVAGPGSGAGGQGTGRGSGGAGDGDGDGDDGGLAPEHIRGRLNNSDYPKGLGEEGIQGLVAVRYRVGEDGRVTDCEVTRSSGSKILDDTTCRLIKDRFRFRPSRDSRGRPVAAYVVENHEWISQHE